MSGGNPMVIELTKQIKLIRPEAKAVFPYSNSLFIDDEIKALIDAGAGGRAYAEIPRAEIQLLLLTHYHFDHINGVSFFPNARKMAGWEEIWAFQDEDKYLESMGYYQWQELMGSPRDEILYRGLILPEDVPSQPGFQFIELAGTFKDGQVFNTGETTFTAVHTPGHSPGHYAFYFPQESILFSGDLDATPRGPWYADEFGSIDDIIMSVNKIISLQPQILVTSHRRIIDSGVEELLRAYLDIVFQREENILNYLSEPRTLNDIADQGFIKEWEQNNTRILFWYKMMIVKHLQRLINNGLVMKIGDNKYIKV
jgi:glyoxylase-like metal-dependent hydrolase (beta-lactamase superfamily II)